MTTAGAVTRFADELVIDERNRLAIWAAEIDRHWDHAEPRSSFLRKLRMSREPSLGLLDICVND